MLLRNSNTKRGLCNGTRLVVTKLLPNLIIAKVRTGTAVDQSVFIPKVYLAPIHSEIPFILRRGQFTVKLAFAMTINKSQGQTLEMVGIYLPEPVFSHGWKVVGGYDQTRKPTKLLLIRGNEETLASGVLKGSWSAFARRGCCLRQGIHGSRRHGHEACSWGGLYGLLPKPAPILRMEASGMSPNIDVGVSVHPKALLNEMGRHDITFTADNAKDHYGGRKFRVHHDRTITKQNLIVYVRTHTGEKPFKCEHCDFRTSYERSLKQHLHNHTGEKSFNCEQCDYRAHWKNNLILHSKIHSGEKPFKCEHCDYQTSHKKSLKTHLCTHTGCVLQQSVGCRIGPPGLMPPLPQYSHIQESYRLTKRLRDNLTARTVQLKFTKVVKGVSIKN
ncbi:hypothetical protein LAZ67_3004529 [Cordylochernes scorpioides]|uniref:C2H2-type domain-containing protein n=1 Tax=Cordylochernes scorpioides TaxID=51811 RepID=A0ABY6K9F8_9ARAC|nr:hypothetical protein LAZ67_3004529 [Cordylochernes scorpioides]